jgi:outer membrane receptor protein involved in Fe transport
VQNAFSGNSHTWIIDGTLKWSPHGNPTQHALKLQGEYLRRTEDGQLGATTSRYALTGPFSSRQSGWYLQGVYQFMPRWRFGARYDALDSGAVHVGLIDSGLLPASSFPLLASAAPSRVTVMFDWNPSEFTRLRLQYAWDDARLDVRDRQLMLQYLFSIGAHGAHKF